MELITTAFRRMLAQNEIVFQENFRRTKMYNFYGDVILKGIQCFNKEHGFIPWQHGENILKELKSVITKHLRPCIIYICLLSIYIYHITDNFATAVSPLYDPLKSFFVLFYENYYRNNFFSWLVEKISVSWTVYNLSRNKRPLIFWLILCR